MRALIGWISRPPSRRKSSLPVFFRASALHRVAMIARHRDRIRITEEVWSMQHHNVQRVALDPFAAIEQSAQRADRRVDLDAERVLDGVHAAHLVGDRTDPTNASDDVEHLIKAASAQQRLEEARRLEDAETHRIDRTVANM